MLQQEYAFHWFVSLSSGHWCKILKLKQLKKQLKNSNISSECFYNLFYSQAGTQHSRAITFGADAATLAASA